LYQLIKAKSADNPDASAVLDAAEGAAEDSAEVRELAATLEKKQATDLTFGTYLRQEWERATVEQHAECDGVTNQVSGQVSGNLVRARDIQGGIKS
jgi:hypothetical protein